MSIYVKIAKFQAECPVIYKTANNPYFKSKYADLAGIMEVIQPLLTKFGLAISHTIGIGEMYTEIIDIETNEKLKSYMYLPADAKMQDLGSAITYAKRYNINALLNLVAELDDDGNVASKVGQNTSSKISQPDQVKAEEVLFTRSNPAHMAVIMDNLTFMEEELSQMPLMISARLSAKKVPLSKVVEEAHKIQTELRTPKK